MSDKRAQFFFFAAVLCLVMLPLAEDKYQEITVGVAITYVLLAVASWLDHRSSSR